MGKKGEAFLLASVRIREMDERLGISRAHAQSAREPEGTAQGLAEADAPPERAEAERGRVVETEGARAERYHSFDCLRAAMMLLGIWMHGVQCYTKLNVYRWPFKDAAQSEVFDFTINWVHIFRMPVFFAMAGFFFALLTARRGARGALLNRANRILLPFVLGWAILAPSIIGTIGYLPHRSWPEAWLLATNAGAYWKNGPLHLWFLEYLLLLYPLMLGVDWVVRHTLGRRGLAASSRLAGRCFQSWWRAPVLALLTGAPMATMGGWLTTPSGFLPSIRILLAYLGFFGFGWVLYSQREQLAQIKRGGWTELLAGIGLAAVGYGVLREAIPERVWIFAGPLATWLFIFGFLSLFLRHLERPISWVRYLADSSYWLYLIHVPVLIWIEVWLGPSTLPPLIKGMLTLSIAMPLMLASYQLGVRDTWLGQLLNGRRYPRGVTSAAAWDRNPRRGS